MPLDNKFRRLALLMEPDIARMVERHAAKSAGHDDVRFDEGHHVVSHHRGGALLWATRGETIGTLTPELGLFRWWWKDRPINSSTKMRLDEAFREGHRYALAELTTDQVYVDSEHEAELIAKVAAQLARADGVLRIEDGTRMTYVALFEASQSELQTALGLASARSVAPDLQPPPFRSQPPPPGSERPDWLAAAHETSIEPSGVSAFTPAAVASTRYSVAAPATRAGVETNSALMRKSTMGFRSMPPVAPIELSRDKPERAPLDMRRPSTKAPPSTSAPPPSTNAPPASTNAPAASLPVREPSREVFLPVAQAALLVIAEALPEGFRQALVVITLDLHEGKGRFLVQLISSDHNGDLRSLDPSRDLLESTGKMIAADAREGNGRWRKLAARMSPTARGAAIDVEVKA